MQNASFDTTWGGFEGETTKEDDGCNIKVVCRFRPETGWEKKHGKKNVLFFGDDDDDDYDRDEVKSNQVIQTQGEPKLKAYGRRKYCGVSVTNRDYGEDYGHAFTFNRVFDPFSTQEDINESIGKPIADSVLMGYNGTVLAYGQTSTGKTFTMQGLETSPPKSLHGDSLNVLPGEAKENSKYTGLVPRIVNRIIDKVETFQTIRFDIRVSMVEIYLERIRDLIGNENNLQIREDPTKGIYIPGAVEKRITNRTDILDIMKLGNLKRSTASTNMNERSSRSHSIFMVSVSQQGEEDISLSTSSKCGKLFLVDLAGSEKVVKAGSRGARLEEAKKINKSLLTLGKVIHALTNKHKNNILEQSHIPYRDSKLTRILQESLGGNSKTALIICCSPSSVNYEETLSTLRFGARAKLIQNRARINEEYSNSQLKSMLLKAQGEISRLRSLQYKISADKEKASASSRAKLNFHESSLGSENEKFLSNLNKSAASDNSNNIIINEFERKADSSNENALLKKKIRQLETELRHQKQMNCFNTGCSLADHIKDIEAKLKKFRDKNTKLDVDEVMECYIEWLSRERTSKVLSSNKQEVLSLTDRLIMSEWSTLMLYRDVQHAKKEITRQSTSESDITKSWKRYYDKNRKAYYYHNVENNITTWTKPRECQNGNRNEPLTY